MQLGAGHGGSRVAPQQRQQLGIRVQACAQVLARQANAASHRVHRDARLLRDRRQGRVQDHPVRRGSPPAPAAAAHPAAGGTPAAAARMSLDAVAVGGRAGRWGLGRCRETRGGACGGAPAPCEPRCGGSSGRSSIRPRPGQGVGDPAISASCTTSSSSSCATTKAGYGRWPSRAAPPAPAAASVTPDRRPPPPPPDPSADRPLRHRWTRAEPRRAAPWSRTSDEGGLWAACAWPFPGGPGEARSITGRASFSRAPPRTVARGVRD